MDIRSEILSALKTDSDAVRAQTSHLVRPVTALGALWTRMGKFDQVIAALEGLTRDLERGLPAKAEETDDAADDDAGVTDSPSIFSRVFST